MRFRLLLLLACLAGCASGSGARSVDGVQPSDRPAEVVFVIPGRLEDITSRVASAFMDKGLPVSGTIGNVVEAKLGRQGGVITQTDITARALIVNSDTGVTVRLYAEESGAETIRIGMYADGRAKQVWQSLLSVAAAVQPDPSRRAAYGGRRPSGLP